jgi:hypothetical protein
MVRPPPFVPGRQARERLRPAGPPHACQRRDRDHRHDRSRMGPGIPGQAGCRTQPDYDHDHALPRAGPAWQTGCPGRWPRGHGDHCTAGRPRHLVVNNFFLPHAYPAINAARSGAGGHADRAARHWRRPARYIVRVGGCAARVFTQSGGGEAARRLLDEARYRSTNPCGGPLMRMPAPRVEPLTWAVLIHRRRNGVRSRHRGGRTPRACGKWPWCGP